MTATRGELKRAELKPDDDEDPDGAEAVAELGVVDHWSRCQWADQEERQWVRATPTAGFPEKGFRPCSG